MIFDFFTARLQREKYETVTAMSMGFKDFFQNIFTHPVFAPTLRRSEAQLPPVNPDHSRRRVCGIRPLCRSRVGAVCKPVAEGRFAANKYIPIRRDRSADGCGVLKNPIKRPTNARSQCSMFGD